MYKKAQGLIDTAILMSLVVLISMFVFSAFNRSTIDLAGKSKVEVVETAGGQVAERGGGTKKNTVIDDIIDIFRMDETQGAKKIPYYSTEVSGALSMLEPSGMTQAQFDSYMSNISYQDLASELDNPYPDAFREKGCKLYGDLAKSANTIIDMLGLSVAPVDGTKTSSATLTSLVSVLNAIATNPDASSLDPGLLNSFIYQFQGLLNKGK